MRSMLGACLLSTAGMLAATCADPPAALAVDGAREIHQSCVATGCFPGDPAGFPVLITEPGSYVLTSNLVLPDENTVGIWIEAGFVTLDLGGFGILGPTVCSEGSPGSCAPSGSGRGILNFNSSGSLTVRNGVIQGIGFAGIVTESGGAIENVTFRHCGGMGAAANRAAIRGNVFDLNFRGLQCAGCVARDNVATRNVDVGMLGGSGSLFVGNSAFANGSYGLSGSGAYDSNRFSGNNGGDANPQVGPGAIPMGINVCGLDTVCP